MFEIQDRSIPLCDSHSRRDILRIGGLSAFGLSLPNLLKLQAANSQRRVEHRMFVRAKNVIYLYLQGGPPQHETFDPKPNAPDGIRGPFNPISTNVPGIQFCELLPRTARMADKLAIVRSMSTDDNVHSSSGYWVLTGYKYRGSNARTIQPTDWPYFGSLVKMLKPSDELPPLSTVWIPDIMRLNESVTPAGQTAGFLGARWQPDRFVGDPNAAAYQVEGLSGDIPAMRFDRRVSLLKQVEQHFANVERGNVLKDYTSYQQQAFDLMSSGPARTAFSIEDEPAKARDRYGRSTWGQCVLMARRLIEAGVRMVHVNWPREAGDNAVDNPMWDTHAQNADRVEDVLCPQFDVGFTALIEDLEQRGLLDETLVVAIGEFGRTPKINAKGGRDHWGPVFSFSMAGAGISGGQVYGSSDKNGAYPDKDKVRPGELTATIFHLLGINSGGAFPDRQGRPHQLTEGAPLFRLLGSETATNDRCPAGGDIARVPPLDRSLLLNTNFSEGVSLRTFAEPSRPKGWRADPIRQGDGFAVELASKSNKVRIGIESLNAKQSVSIKPKPATLAQEVRSPFAGRFRLQLAFRGIAVSKAEFERVFANNFRCKLLFYQYGDQKKSVSNRRVLAEAVFQPTYSSDNGTLQTAALEKNFINPSPGGNFSFGSGLGVAVHIERIGQQNVQSAGFTGIEIDRVELEFIGKQRIDTVKV